MFAAVWPATRVLMSDLPTGTSGERPRVALFQAFWRLHSSTVYSAQVLADSGYRVEVFLFTVDDSIPMSALNDAEGIFVHRIEAGKNFPRSAGGSSLPVPQLRRIFSALRRRAMMPLWSYVLLLLKSDKGLIPKDVLDQTIRAMDGQRYTAVYRNRKRRFNLGRCNRAQAPNCVYLFEFGALHAQRTVRQE